LAALDLETIL